MRTTVLLILLVVLVSTGEALQCNTLDGSTVECKPDFHGVCVHYKYEDEEFKSCAEPELCKNMKSSFTQHESEHATFICCPEELCN
uniref:Plethodontid modulating factor n=1 Tax=Plethodon hoffmani TaxID=154583 RepID=Q0GAE6_9SALA|nr:plethodontid modulating factor [Plethodon hoffmani]